MDNKPLLWSGIGCIIGFVLSCMISCGCLTLGGATLIAQLLREPEKIWVTVDAPPVVSRGEAFSLSVTIRNLADRPQRLHNIDIGMSYLQGFRVATSEPPYKEASGDNSFRRFQRYTFEHEIPPGESLIIRFHVAAVKAGDYVGDLDVCIRSSGNCVSTPISTAVTQGSGGS